MIKDSEWKKFFPSSQTTILDEENIVPWKKYYFTEIFFFFFFETEREVSQYSSTAESLKQWYEHDAEICEAGHKKENKISKSHMEHIEFEYLEIYQTFFFQVFRLKQYFCWLDYMKDWKRWTSLKRFLLGERSRRR